MVVHRRVLADWGIAVPTFNSTRIGGDHDGTAACDIAGGPLGTACAVNERKVKSAHRATVVAGPAVA
jgi:hypothetical protein